MGTDAHPMTLECAFYLAAGNSGMTVIGSPSLTGGGFPWLNVLLFHMNTVGSLLRLNYNGVDADVVFLSTPAQDAWHMLAVEITGTTHHVVKVWLDGVWQGSVTSTDTITSHSFSGGELVNQDHYLDIGRHAGNDQWIGYLDEMRISEQSFLPDGGNYSINPDAFPES